MIGDGQTRKWFLSGCLGLICVLGVAWGETPDQRTDLKEFPELPPALLHLSRGMAFGEKKQFGPALREYQEAVKADQNCQKAWVGIGICQGRTGHHQDAARAFETAVALDPDDAESYYNLGVSRQAFRDWEGASRAYHHALRLKPANSDGWFNFGLLEKRLGRFETAAEAFAESWMRHPSDLKSFDLLAECLRRAKQPKLGEHLLDRFVAFRAVESGKAHPGLGASPKANGSISSSGGGDSPASGSAENLAPEDPSQSPMEPTILPPSAEGIYPLLGSGQ
jgi:Tfp pilus assembly protein PilF